MTKFAPHKTLKLIACDKFTFDESVEIHLVARKVDIRLPGKVHSKSMAQGRSTKIISMIKWIRISRLSIKNSLSRPGALTTPRERESFIDNLLVRIHLIIEMIWWTIYLPRTSPPNHLTP